MSLREWLEGIYTEHGTLTPALVREAARPDESAGHAFVFNLPPDEAAEAHYLERAHALIRLVRVRVEQSATEPPRSVRLFHAIINEEGALTYEPLVRLQHEPDLYAQAHAAALNRVQQAESAVRDLEDIAGTPALAAKATVARRRLSEAREALASPAPASP